MAAAVRYPWMFRAAAVLCVLLGCLWLGGALFTGFRPDLRPYSLAMGAIAVLLGVLVFRRNRLAIGATALAAGCVSILAALAAPTSRGPGVLLLAVLSLVCGLYAALSARALFGRD